MTKKEYMKPSVKVVELQQNCQILAGSPDACGMNPELQEDEEVDEDDIRNEAGCLIHDILYSGVGEDWGEKE